MKAYRYKAKIEAARGGGTFVFFPHDVEKEFGTKGRVPVQAKFDGVAYRGSLMKYGHPQHMLGLPKEIREQIAKGPGDTVEVELWKDEEERKVEVPAQLLSAIRKAKLNDFFDGLSYTHQREYCRWITEAKKEETRARRIEQAIEMMKKKIRTPDA